MAHGAPTGSSASAQTHAPPFPPHSFAIADDLQGLGTGTVENPRDDYPAGPRGTPEVLLLAATRFYGHRSSPSPLGGRLLRIGDSIHLPGRQRFRIEGRGGQPASREGPWGSKES